MLFLENPTKGFGLVEISKKLKLGPPSVKRYLDEMEMECLILVKSLHNRKLYFANRENRKFKIYQVFHIFIKIENSGLLAFIEKELKFPTIILFGSYAIGEATEKSDMDIAIISSTKKYFKMDEFEKSLGKTIHIFVFTNKEFGDLKRKNKDLYNNILNGRILSGYLNVV